MSHDSQTVSLMLKFLGQSEGLWPNAAWPVWPRHAPDIADFQMQGLQSLTAAFQIVLSTIVKASFCAVQVYLSIRPEMTVCFCLNRHLLVKGMIPKGI